MAKLNKKKYILAFVASLLVLSTGVSGAFAYFTTFVTAKGGYTIELDSKTKINEEAEALRKTVSIENVGKMEVYVRVKVLAGAQIDLSYEGTSSKWSYNAADDYWYYADILGTTEDTKNTENLIITISQDDKLTSSYNVVVIQECTPAVYDAEGKPYRPENAVWDLTAKSEEEVAD